MNEARYLTIFQSNLSGRQATVSVDRFPSGTVLDSTDVRHRRYRNITPASRARVNSLLRNPPSPIRADIYSLGVAIRVRANKPWRVK